jgi:hypothetical protein
MTSILALAARVAILILIVGAVACGGKGGPIDPPTDLVAAAGDGRVTLSWTAESGVEYWVFYAPDPSITLSNWTSISGASYRIRATSPQVIDGLTNGTAYTFIVNARTPGGKGGPGSLPVTATPRLAGAVFSAGIPVPVASLNGVVGTSVTLNGTTWNGLWSVGSGGTVWQSTDGSSWTALTSPTTNNLNAITFGANTWYAVGDNGTIIGSANTPQAWGLLGSPTSARLNGVAVLNANVTAVGDNGTIVLGTGGSTYSLVTGSTDQHLSGVVAGNAELIAVGHGGTILHSVDGTTWESRISPTTADLFSVAYGNGRYVAVGSGGVIVTSTDGVTWTLAASPVTADLLGVTYGSQFVAVGRGGVAVVTPDTGSWSLPATGLASDLFAVGWGLAQYTAVGSSGVNVYSR